MEELLKIHEKIEVLKEISDRREQIETEDTIEVDNTPYSYDSDFKYVKDPRHICNDDEGTSSSCISIDSASNDNDSDTTLYCGRVLPVEDVLWYSYEGELSMSNSALFHKCSSASFDSGCLPDINDKGNTEQAMLDELINL